MTDQPKKLADTAVQYNGSVPNGINSSTKELTPAEQLVGKVLANGWKVVELLERPTNATGGRFSIPYVVHSREGKQAFLKAMDYTSALEANDTVTALYNLTAEYKFERDLLEKCKKKGLSRIVRILDSGKLPPQDGNLGNVVEYLIFEFARGDIRSVVDINKAVEIAWALHIIHQAAAALQQLHSSQIAHQDLKPSNVLIFEGFRSKLADLGRAFDFHRASPHDELDCAGDLTYAPPELLYGYVPQDWCLRRLGCDMYLFGSLVVFFCTKVSMTHLLGKRLNKEHHWRYWSGTYREVLPYIQEAFAAIVRELHEEISPDYPKEIPDLVKQLCNPNPDLRGHPKNFGKGNKYALERYVSIFDRLAKKAEWSLTKKDALR